MAVFLPHFRLAKLIGTHEADWPEPTVKALLERGRRDYGEPFAEEIKTATIMVNGRAVAYLRGLDTPLKASDRVSTLSMAAPAEG